MTRKNSQKTRNNGKHPQLDKKYLQKNLIANIRFNSKTSALLNLM